MTTGSSDLANTNCGVSSPRGCLENGDQVTATNVDGTVTMTFSDVNPASNNNFIQVDADGIWFDECGNLGSCGAQQNAAGSFGISFSRDVSLQEYTVGYVYPGTPGVTGGFQIFSNAGLTASLTSLASLETEGGPFTVAPTPLFTANTVYYVKGSTTDLAQLASIGVFIEDTNGAVPEPGSLALLGLGLAGLGFSRRRKAD